MSEEEDVDYERTLLQLPQVYVFKIPVRKTADGHRASDWPKDPAWTGKLKIVAKRRLAAIFLLDDKNQIFAACHVNDDAAVERVLDSGRYFVLRITNDKGRHAFIGICFNERNDAFDFNVALAEFKAECDREAQAASASSSSAGAAAGEGLSALKDLSIKDGEKIKIKINTRKKADSDSSAPSASASSSSSAAPSSFGRLLPPPPSKPSSSSSSTSSSSSSSTSSSSSSSLSLSGGPATVFRAAAPSSGSDPFASSDPFTADPFAAAFPTPAAVPAQPRPQPPFANLAAAEPNLLDL